MGVTGGVEPRMLVPVERVDVAPYTVPTTAPESDGTLQWDATTIVVVELDAGGVRGLGYTYADRSTAVLIRDRLAGIVVGRDAMAVPDTWMAMRRTLRNLGVRGIGAMAISAVDCALWDLKARLLGVPLLVLLGAVRERIDVYGSGGFTSYTLEELVAQLGGWAQAGFRRVKMKVGRAPEDDVARVREARAAIGDEIELFVDANGAYELTQALAFAHAFAEHDVRWFEEPVSSDDLAGLRAMRARGPAGMQIAAGEYGYTPDYFRTMLAAEAVDALQADATRCCGISGFLEAAALAEAAGRPLSAHTAPSLHAPVCCALPAACHVEYFHDHARIEQMLFDGAAQVRDGAIAPDPARPGFGLEFKRADAARYAV